MSEICDLCGRTVEVRTKHHLIPKTRHKNKKNKRDFERAEVKETVYFCIPCHKQIHKLLTEKELEREYNSLEAIKNHKRVKKFIEWIKHKDLSDIKL